MSEAQAMIRVLYLSATAHVGGAEESLLTLLRHLDRARITPVLGCPDAPADQAGAAPQRDDLRTQASAVGIEVVSCPVQRLQRTWNPAALLAAWRQVAEVRRCVSATAAERAIDLIHANSPTAALCAAGAPVLCHLRDLRLPFLASRFLRRRVAMVVATSQVVVALARRRFGAGVRRIPNGVDPEIFQPGRAEGGQTPYVLMAANIVPWKRHDLFLECLAEIRARDAGVRGIIVGADLFDEHLQHAAWLMERARDLGLQHALTWKAGVRRAEMAALLAGAAVVIHPAGAEPFGRIVIEAMASATPVVAVDAAGPQEILAQGGGVLVRAGDVAGMAHAALAYLANPQRAREDGQRGRQVVLERYSATGHARAMTALYEEMVGHREAEVRALEAPVREG